MGNCLGLVHIHRSTARLADKDQKYRASLKAEGGCHDSATPREDAQDLDIFNSLTGALYVVVNSQKDIVPRGFDVRIEEIQEKHQQAIEEKDATIALLSDDLKNCKYENLGVQDEIKTKDQPIAALEICYVYYLSDEDKYNGISIIAKGNEEAEYLYIYMQTTWL